MRPPVLHSRVRESADHCVGRYIVRYVGRYVGQLTETGGFRRFQSRRRVESVRDLLASRGHYLSIYHDVGFTNFKRYIQNAWANARTDGRTNGQAKLVSQRRLNLSKKLISSAFRLPTSQFTSNVFLIQSEKFLKLK